MTLKDTFLAALEREAPRTRRVVEQVPTGRDDWKPHAKSMPLGRLAGMVASMNSWFSLILDQDELDLTPPPGGGQHRPSSMDSNAPRCTSAGADSVDSTSLDQVAIGFTRNS